MFVSLVTITKNRANVDRIVLRTVLLTILQPIVVGLKVSSCALVISLVLKLYYLQSQIWFLSVLSLGVIPFLECHVIETDSLGWPFMSDFIQHNTSESHLRTWYLFLLFYFSVFALTFLDHYISHLSSSLLM